MWVHHKLLRRPLMRPRPRAGINPYNLARLKRQTRLRLKVRGPSADLLLLPAMLLPKACGCSKRVQPLIREQR